VPDRVLQKKRIHEIVTSSGLCIRFKYERGSFSFLKHSGTSLSSIFCSDTKFNIGWS
jgi:hypothetical protein